MAYRKEMNATNLQQGPPMLRPEADADRLTRIAHEEAVIAKAEADIDAGLGIGDEDLEAWLDSLDLDEASPLPSPRSASAAR